MEEKKISEMWDKLIDLQIATEEELQLVTSLNGYNLQTLEDILYIRTGYRNFEQLEAE